ncbi:Uncharacterised protein [Mycobacteroides abscessus subsp. abscessus]|nr:Uncharacterised protein [Mycobacteroides abscessus subsp. abscessus]
MPATGRQDPDQVERADPLGQKRRFRADPASQQLAPDSRQAGGQFSGLGFIGHRFHKLRQGAQAVLVDLAVRLPRNTRHGYDNKG